ncbi:cytochrome P450 315a1, mitochondrial [Ooceraea biroi]|uniref:cytochrome P450 315a1, mitochondrial n=1 Tax=Ooceraea biroi TaxID=2015173 RepID=UPI000F078BA2|nr:cytochrome P450 315a1, mitochondrial [Ooceraea biroi]
MPSTGYAAIVFLRAGASTATKEMHVVQRVSRRISRLANFCGGFNVPFLECRTPGCLGFFLINNDVASPPKNPVDQTAIRSRTVSRLLTRGFSTLVRKEPPEPRGIPFFGTMLSLIMAGGAQKLHEYVDKRHRELGPVYREQIGPVRGIFVNSPDEFRSIFLRLEGPTPQHFLPESWMLYNEIRSQRRGLLFMDGDEWLHFRKILNKTLLLPNSTKLMSAPCQEAAENLTNKWKSYSRRHVTIPNLEHRLYLWSIETMLATLMGSKWRNCEQQMRLEAEYLALILHDIFVYSSTLSMLPAKLAMKLKLPVWTKFVQAADAILAKLHKLVPDMIRLNGDGLLATMMENGIRDEDATRIVTDFIIAAGDTTAVTLQWALLLLSSRPELQDQLFHDMKKLSLEELLQYQLLRGVWRETLRLHPVAPFLTRYLPADSTIGDYFVPKGELVILSIYSSGRSENDFPQPNEFQPERWSRMKGGYQGVKNSFATLPFALGARSCIGRKLAETQLSLALAQLIKTFKIDCENRDSIKMILHLTSMPSQPVKLKLTEREA